MLSSLGIFGVLYNQDDGFYQIEDLKRWPTVGTFAYARHKEVTYARMYVKIA